MKKLVLALAFLVVLAVGYWILKGEPSVEAPLQRSNEEETAEDTKSDASSTAKGQDEDQTQTDLGASASTTIDVGGSAASTSDVAGAQEINMTSGYAFFTPKTMTLKVGRKVKLTIQNSGRHNIMIDELGVAQDLENGTNVVEFTPQTAGVFIYYCSVPGHRQAGQWGTVTVEE